MIKQADLNAKDPLEVFQNWLALARKETGMISPEAMVLSSRHPSARRKLSSRVVLLKEVKEGQLIFYTNYNSLKAQQLKWGGALNFYWDPLRLQIRMEGKVKKTSRKQSVNYWNTRSRESQISQYISKQSSQLKNRKVIEELWEKTKKRFKGKKIPCPAHWGGFAFRPDLVEFWEEGFHRFHHRLLFTRKKKGWSKILLYP